MIFKKIIPAIILLLVFSARAEAIKIGLKTDAKEIKIAAKTVPAFSAGKKFKELVNKK